MKVKRHTKSQTPWMSLSAASAKPALKRCPFCASRVVTNVSHNGIRFFECPECGAKTTFQYADEKEAVRLWNLRLEGCHDKD